MENVTLAPNQSVITSSDETALVKAARSDPAAFTILYRRYVTPVYRYLHKWVGNTAEAEDLTAQVFTEMLERLEQYQERGHFAAWLFTIARRKAIAAYRHRRTTLDLDEAEDLPAPSEDPLEKVARAEQLQRMTALIAKLPEDQRELIRLRFTAGLSYADIGALLDRTEAAVKMAVHRLLRKLNEQWETK
jgi:RNA polymerase sigma-70 factor (ECF subfamily)